MSGYVTDVGFIETSALTGEAVDDCFLKLTKSVISKIDSGTCTFGDVCVVLSLFCLC